MQIFRSSFQGFVVAALALVACMLVPPESVGQLKRLALPLLPSAAFAVLISVPLAFLFGRPLFGVAVLCLVSVPLVWLLISAGIGLVDAIRIGDSLRLPAIDILALSFSLIFLRQRWFEQ